MKTLTLPWPSSKLSSNARVHWSKRAKATASARWAASVIARSIKWDRPDNPVLTFAFHPPDRRRRDCQNMPAMCKAMIDGIADSWDIDDSNFRCVFPSQFEEPVKGGKVVITVEGG